MNRTEKTMAAKWIAASLTALIAAACSSNQTHAGTAEAHGEVSASMNPGARERAGAERNDSETTVALSPDMRAECQMVASSGEAPQFDYDEAKLRPRGADILKEVAKCLTDGPLEGRAITVIGRTDPRGTEDHNQELGASRATAVRDYLSSRGVTVERINLISRGEKGAVGNDEASWASDRRVDIELGKVTARAASMSEPVDPKAGGPLVDATRKTIATPKAMRGASYSDAVETGAGGPPHSEAVPPPSVPTPSK